MMNVSRLRILPFNTVMRQFSSVQTSFLSHALIQIPYKYNKYNKKQLFCSFKRFNSTDASPTQDSQGSHQSTKAKTDSSQDISHGFCDKLKTMKNPSNPSSEEIAEIFRKYNIKVKVVEVGPIHAQDSQTKQTYIEEKQNQQQSNQQPSDKELAEASWSTKLSRSYVLPFTIMSGTFGFALTYVSNNPVFILCSIPLGICAGMLRDKNKKTKNDNYITAGIKAITIYSVGPFVALGGIALIIMMASK